MALSPPTTQGPSSFAYAAGDLIAGKYELEEMLGEGGMGAVFRARNTAIDMPVAIKVMRSDLNRELLGGRLLQEARAAAKLSHPAIVRVFDVGQTALGDPFIVMELLSGESLSATMQREGRLTSMRAVQLLLPIADALSAAHAKGFVHRDVKPDNVFVVVNEEQLQPKLVDFGIVKLEQRDKNSQLTQVGTVLGSPDYMSPEQARGLENIDLRSDVWSFAVMLYEAIAGETPFSSSNYNALLRMIVEVEPKSLLELSAADAELSAIVTRGMSKDPAYRFQSMSQFGRALAEWLAAQGIAEDACGISLEARWLSRSNEPQGHAAARISRSPESWPEPPSGIRAVRSDLGTAPTLALGKEAGTPVSVLPLAATIPPGVRRVYLGIAASAVALALPLLWLALSSAVPPDPASAAGSTIEAAPEPRPTPARAAPSAPEASLTPAATVTAEPTAPAAASLASSRRQAKPRALAPPRKPKDATKPAPAEPNKVSPPATPGSDLLSPY